jgi:hypothetical protein
MTPEELAPPKPGKARVVARHPYEDENGALLYQFQRFEPKKIRPRRPDGKGGWIYNLGKVRVLYRLPQLISAVKADETIFVCEGEKDVDRLRSLGFGLLCGIAQSFLRLRVNWRYVRPHISELRALLNGGTR